MGRQHTQHAHIKYGVPGIYKEQNPHPLAPQTYYTKGMHHASQQPAVSQSVSQEDQKHKRRSHAQVASTRGSKRENATPATNSVCPTHRSSTGITDEANDDAADGRDGGGGGGGVAMSLVVSHKTTFVSYDAVARTPVGCGQQRSLLTAYRCCRMTARGCLHSAVDR